MKHLGTKEIRTERLILRRFTLEDAEPMYHNWASDGEVTKYLTWAAHSDIETTRKVLKLWLAGYEKPAFYQWAIVPKNFGEPIGTISAVDVNDKKQSVEIGYCIGRQWWHQGIVSEALAAVLDYFLNQVGANRVAARHDTANPHSGMVMQKCGMQYEGTLRQADWNNQGICDCSYYSVLAAD